MLASIRTYVSLGLLVSACFLEITSANPQRYIDYGSIQRGDGTPCSLRHAASAQNCRPNTQNRPYTRGCSAAAGCRTGGMEEDKIDGGSLVEEVPTDGKKEDVPTDTDDSLFSETKPNDKPEKKIEEEVPTDSDDSLFSETKPDNKPEKKLEEVPTDTDDSLFSETKPNY